MIAAFVDESGNDSHSKIFAMATLLISNSSSYYFGNAWDEMLKRFGVSEFHATDFHRRRGEFEHWAEERCSDLGSAIVELLLRWQVKHSAALVENAGYVQSFVETGFSKGIKPAVNKWKKPYLLAFQHTVADLREYADDQDAGVFITPVFDNCQEFMSQATQYYEKRNADGRLGRMHVVGSRGEYVQLQAADFLCWEYRVHAEEFLKTGNLLPNPALGAVRAHTFGAKLWSFKYLEYLRARVEAANSGGDPESIAMPQ